MNKLFNRGPKYGQRQEGAITMFSAILILILLTEMIIYAVHTGVFEQRKSSNEMRQKLAFHLADSSIQQAKQYLLANRLRAASGKTTGWLEAGTLRWQPCSGITDTTHPCFAESNAAMRTNSYFYSVGGSNELPIDPAALGPKDGSGTVQATPATQQVTLHAVLCMLDIDRTKDPVVQGCTTDAAKQDDRYFMVTLAARGQADCLADGTQCKAEALVSEKVGSFGPGGGDGGPGVPLTARTSVELKGTVEIVPNPNGGGVGVPISTWLNANDDPACNAAADPVDPVSGSWTTCERHEWYGIDTLPADYKCTINNGNGCACKESEGDKLLSYRHGNETQMSIDIVVDPDFPCDLFQYTFGVPKTNWKEVKAMVPPLNVLDSCDSLDETSAGMYWITGSECDIKSTQTVGSPDFPVFLISAATDTTIHGDLYGVLFVTDVEDANAEFKGNGQGTIYGAAVMEVTMKNFNGTFQIVYIDTIVGTALDNGAFGAVQGGWTDFHSSWK